MKKLLFMLLGICPLPAIAQQLELHYDFRHTLGPKRQAENYPTIYFEYFRSKDFGSTLIKLQADLNGNKNNTGQSYFQVSQTAKFWQPKIYLNVGYSGGLGVIKSINSAFYITNTYTAGAAYPFLGKNAWYSAVLCYKYVAFDKPSNDPQMTFYFGKGINNYKYIVSGSLVFWTENNNHGDDYTKALTGKKFAFFGEPQIWYNCGKSFWVGSKINLYYHVLVNDNIFQAYPTMAIKYKFE